MAILIDGYNLLHASGVMGRGRGPGFLERSRQALLNFLVESLDEQEAARCTVVFDAANTPTGLPRTTSHRGIAVKFAAGKADADELIEELIVADSSPRKLTVVSSDHRLHRAAKRRKATPVDSDIWFTQLVRRRSERQRSPATSDAKPPAPSTPGEMQFWLRAFGVAEKEVIDKPPVDTPPAEVDNPFPPGYAEDINDETL
jgi:predicted RNA-binding protein with PIN domain